MLLTKRFPFDLAACRAEQRLENILFENKSVQRITISCYPVKWFLDNGWHIERLV